MSTTTDTHRQTPTTSLLTIRSLGRSDLGALTRLAQRDSAAIPAMPALGAELDGRLVAAIFAERARRQAARRSVRRDRRRGRAAAACAPPSCAQPAAARAAAGAACGLAPGAARAARSPARPPGRSRLLQL